MSIKSSKSIHVSDRQESLDPNSINFCTKLLFPCLEYTWSRRALKWSLLSLQRWNYWNWKFGFNICCVGEGDNKFQYWIWWFGALQQVTETLQSNNKQWEGETFRVWDEADYVVPPAENGAFFITTNVLITPNQTQVSTLREGVNWKKKKCVKFF